MKMNHREVYVRSRLSDVCGPKGLTFSLDISAQGAGGRGRVLSLPGTGRG